MQRVVILVPRRAGIEDRDRLWEHARAWWERDYPDWQIVEGHHDVGPFNRGLAINRAAQEAGDWDVAVIIDSDVLCPDVSPVKAAVDMAYASNRMVLAYHERVHLTPRGTERVLSGYKGNWKAPGMVAKILTDACSSCVVVSRKLWDTVGGFDERFVGWGWEDVAFRVACETLSEGPMVTVASTIWHLHHRTSHENNARERTFQANKERGERYRAALGDPVAVRALIDEPLEAFISTTPDPSAFQLGPTLIPRILHRTVPEISEQSDQWWEHWRQLLPGWELKTHRDPLDPGLWPETSDLWPLCKNGAQKAGLIRLEALWRDGGVYVDSDVEPYRSLEPLLNNRGFAAWEDAKVVPDAVLGAEPAHPAVGLMLAKARWALENGQDAWHSGPGVTTAVLPGRPDWLLLPPGAFFPYHYKEPNRRTEPHMDMQPWCFAAHHWAGSWLTPKQKMEQRRARR
jgi:hypothetical protein